MDGKVGHVSPRSRLGQEADNAGSRQDVVRTDGRSRSDESWVEVSSQPSSSSLSSAADEIVTDGLRVHHDSNRPRGSELDRRSRSTGLHMAAQLPSGGGNSSQEEYDESESESDRAMASSSEIVQPLSHHQHWHSPARPTGLRHSYRNQFEDELGEEEDDNDDMGTAVNMPSAASLSFRPQPNAFTRPPPQPASRPHPLRHHTQAHSTSSSRPPPRAPNQQRHSFAGNGLQHSPFGLMSNSHQADYDAALRASLSTLLSAAAARGKSRSSAGAIPTQTGPAAFQPTGLRFVSESELMGTAPAATGPGTAGAHANEGTSAARDDASRRPSSRERERRGKQKASRRSPSSAAVAAGFGGQNGSGGVYGLAGYSIDDISPTLLTWMVSAGVVVLVGALSFSAGYVVGREVGREEANAAVAGMVGGSGGTFGGVGVAACGGESLGRGGGVELRRLRWGDGLGLAV